jgi:putative addiction module component (TIGR02574 family)
MSSLGIDQLSPADRLRLAEEIWDSLSEKELGDIPESHRQELDRRLKNQGADPAATTPWQSLVVPILSFAPDPYVPLKEIPVVVKEAADGFYASLYDANLSMCGETEADAIAALKAYIVHVFETLQRLPKLGPGPARQLAVLRSLIKRVE